MVVNSSHHWLLDNSNTVASELHLMEQSEHELGLGRSRAVHSGVVAEETQMSGGHQPVAAVVARAAHDQHTCLTLLCTTPLQPMGTTVTWAWGELTYVHVAREATTHPARAADRRARWPGRTPAPPAPSAGRPSSDAR